MFYWLQLFLMLAIFNLNQANAKITKTETETEINYDIVVEGLKVETSETVWGTFETLSLKGVNEMEGIIPKEGEPNIPVIRFYVNAQSPDSIRIKTVAGKSTPEKYQLKNLIPVIKSVEKSLTRENKIFFAKGFRSKRYPNVQDNISILKVGSVDGVGKYLVTITPVTFDGTTSVATLNNQHFIANVKKSKEDIEKVKNKNVIELFLVGEKFKNSPSLKKYFKAKKFYQRHQVIVKNISFDADSEEIRSLVQKVYKESKGKLKFLTIIGDSDDVSAHESEKTGTRTDHFYAAIDTEDYADDINSPDISVGRISVGTEEQLAVVLKKNTAYLEKEKFKLFYKRTNKLAFIATDDRYTVAEGSHNYVINNYTMLNGYTGSFPLNDALGGDKLYAITNRVSDEAVVSHMNEGRSIINYSGHGSDDGWYGPTIKQDDVKSLTSNTMPFVISNACLTGNYLTDESFAETWQRHPYGSIMFWGSTTYTYWDEDDILEKRMYDNIFKDHERNFGNMTNYALSEVWKYYGGEGRSQYYWEAYHLFGDPSLNLIIL